MKQILVIDDSETITSLLREFFHSHGYEVRTASTADQGFQQIQQRVPELILLDIQLPDIDGFELCRMLRTRPETRLVPILMITATATQAHDKVKGFQVGADDYIVKPFDMNELLERVRAVLKRSELRLPARELSTRAQAPAGTSSPPPQALPVKQAIPWLLLSPHTFPADRPLPSVTLAYLLALVILLVLGLAGSPGITLKPLMVCLLALALWGLLVTTLVVGGSLVGMPLSWREGSRVLCLAGLPLLLKLAGGCALSAFTSLSPFLFTAGPALLGASAAWLSRLDLFEIGSIGLLWLLLRKRHNASARAATLCALVVWAVALVLAWVMSRLGGSV